MARLVGKQAITIAPAASRVGVQHFVVETPDHSAALLFLTGPVDVPGMTLQLEYEEPVAGVWVLSDMAAMFGGGPTPAFTRLPSDDVPVLPLRWRLVVTPPDSDPHTYSIGAVLIP